MRNVYSDFFKLMEKGNLKYALLERETVFQKPIDGDIDVWVEDISKFESLIRANNVHILQKLIHHYKGINYYLLFKGQLLNIDVYEEIVYKHRNLFSKTFFQKCMQKKGDLYFVNKSCFVKYYLVKKIIKKDLQEKMDYFVRVINLITFDGKVPKELEDNLKLLLFKREKDLVTSEVLEQLENYILKNSPFCYKSLLFEIKRIFLRLIKPSGLVVAFLGPDGVGKSSLIKRLQREKLPFRRVEVFHLKPGILGRKKRASVITEPHKKKLYGKFTSLLKLMQFFLEYTVGYFLKVFPLKVKSTFVIFDRYYDDLLIDPIRYRYGGSLKLASFLKKFIFKPDIYIVLMADPEVIYSRKKELDLKEIEKQILRLKEIVDNKRYFEVNASYSIDDSLAEVKKVIFSYLVRKHD